jgi:hypothetical protein
MPLNLKMFLLHVMVMQLIIKEFHCPHHRLHKNIVGRSAGIVATDPRHHSPGFGTHDHIFVASNT